MALKLKNASSDWPDCLGGGRNYRVLKHHAVLLSAPNRFGSKRNYTVLKPLNRAVAIDELRKEVELRGSQTYTQAKDIDRLTWKKIELQGSQTVHFNLRLV